MASYAVRTNDATPTGAVWGARFAAAAVVVASFWFVGHSLIESKVIAEEQALGPDRAENRVAIQQRDTTTSSAVGYFLLGGVGAAALVTAPRRGRRWNAALLLLFAAYMAWCFMTILWSIDPMQSFRKLVIVGLMMTAAFGAAQRFELEDVVWILLIALTAIVGVGVLAEAAYGTLRPWRSDYRFCGTVHPNDQGVQCALLVLAAACAERRGGKRGWWLGGLLILALGGVWFTKSRTTLAALVGAAAVGLIVRARGGQRWLVLAGCVAAACIAGIGWSFVSVSAVDETADVAAMGRRKDVNSLTGRLPLWEELVKAAERRPWLGYGYGGFWNSETTLKYSEIFAWHIPHGHNAYLDLVLNIGAAGLVLYLLWFFAATGTTAVRYEQSGRSGELFAVCLCVFALIHGATESKFPGTGIGGLALMTVMTMVAVRRPEPARQPAPARSAPVAERGSGRPTRQASSPGNARRVIVFVGSKKLSRNT